MVRWCNFSAATSCPPRAAKELEEVSVFLQLKRLLWSDDELINSFCARGRPDLAWKVLQMQGFEELRREPTSTYSVNFAERELKLAELACEANALEWVWASAASCLAVLEWKGQLDSSTAQDARELISKAEGNLPRERVDDMKEKHDATVKQHNSLDELRFKQRMNQGGILMWAWRKGVGKRVPDLSERPY